MAVALLTGGLVGIQQTINLYAKKSLANSSSTKEFAFDYEST